MGRKREKKGGRGRGVGKEGGSRLESHCRYCSTEEDCRLCEKEARELQLIVCVCAPICVYVTIIIVCYVVMYYNIYMCVCEYIHDYKYMWVSIYLCV